MTDLLRELYQTVEEVAKEPELDARSTHHRLEHVFLHCRNAAVLAAAVLFIAALFHIPHREELRALGYFVGGFAYFCEIILMTDCFSRRVERRELFMACCFGPLYILMGMGYLFA